MAAAAIIRGIVHVEAQRQLPAVKVPPDLEMCVRRVAEIVRSVKGYLVHVKGMHQILAPYQILETLAVNVRVEGIGGDSDIRLGTVCDAHGLQKRDFARFLQRAVFGIGVCVGAMGDYAMDEISIGPVERVGSLTLVFDLPVRTGRAQHHDFACAR